jgi:glycosyltransferase involved in cell wall biosynthesis
MAEVFDPILAFVPCHNRCSITVAFLESLQQAWPSGASLVIHVLDDGSSDGTADAVRSRWPEICLHHLDGRQFWGGALNKIQSLLANPEDLGLKPEADPWVLVVNDDLQFCSGSLERALSLLPHSDVLAPAIEGGWGRVAFDSSKGRFLEFPDCGVSNLATTMATFVRRSTWLQAEPVPKGIPHYLSDYWFTHSLSCKGFRVATDTKYRVVIRKDTTRPSGPQDPGWRARRAYWRRCLDPLSPDYIPAAITFRRRFSAEPHRFWSLAVLGAKAQLYRLLTGYRPGPLASLQA